MLENSSGLISITKRLLKKNPTWRRITVNEVADNDVHVEMDKLDIIKEMIGMLWEMLTGREHLQFYGRLKILSGSALDFAIEESLGTVNLLLGGAADKQVRKYSGGMKRRLSIAILLIGDAEVVYMDDPVLD
ncbi:hypothetical protein ZWY2020_052358 [Hordeum vulgare]|nr:hypothetical protein ZWY2020_052358 [Hordeum vulgare]